MTEILIWVTGCIFILLIIYSVHHSRAFSRRCREELNSWRTLCEGITQADHPRADHLRADHLRATSFTSEHWRYLKMNVLTHSERPESSAEDRAAVERGDLIYPQWIPLGQSSAPLLSVTYLPSPQQLIPPPGHWGAFAPGLSTMIGVLGTFFGIQYGLSESNLGAGIAGTGEAAEQITALMGGASVLFNSMSFAFITSLGGLLTAILTTMILLRTHRARENACRALSQLQDERFCVRSTAQSVHQLSEELSQLKLRQSESIESLQSRLEHLSQESLLNHGNQQELIAEMMVQIDDLLSFHLPRDPR